MLRHEATKNMQTAKIIPQYQQCCTIVLIYYHFTIVFYDMSIFLHTAYFIHFIWKHAKICAMQTMYFDRDRDYCSYCSLLALKRLLFAAAGVVFWNSLGRCPAFIELYSNRVLRMRRRTFCSSPAYWSCVLYVRIRNAENVKTFAVIRPHSTPKWPTVVEKVLRPINEIIVITGICTIPAIIFPQ